jgi:bifunctional DNase/RNase
VTELRKGTYYAVMDLQTRNGTVEIDARPSDAIAIALRLNAPIFVRDPVFAEAGEMVIPDFERREEERLPERRRRQPIGISPATPQRSL